SSYLLSHVSGISSSIASNIVQKRNENGGFKNRKELESVSRFTAKVFEQSAGFLRIYNNDQILDSTFIHPEKYSIIESWCNKQKISIKELVKDNEIIKQLKDDQELSQELGSYTHLDIVKALAAPQQDPRTIFESFKYRDDISKISDLDEGQYYPGIVTNITQFGAFVDIGIKENGLIHISQMSDKFIDNAFSELKVGQTVNARLLKLDIDRKRISLSLKKS
ncbi:MAG: S1 RNA-binding domain-containing protein, partial [Bdellovibrionales bacterium]|nr:S1 RNA-binding domain-containing protein [Bdellovibrionales bacterium]